MCTRTCFQKNHRLETSTNVWECEEKPNANVKGMNGLMRSNFQVWGKGSESLNGYNQSPPFSCPWQKN